MGLYRSLRCKIDILSPAEWTVIKISGAVIVDPQLSAIVLCILDMTACKGRGVSKRCKKSRYCTVSIRLSLHINGQGMCISICFIYIASSPSTVASAPNLRSSA